MEGQPILQTPPKQIAHPCARLLFFDFFFLIRQLLWESLLRPRVWFISSFRSFAPSSSVFLPLPPAMRKLSQLFSAETVAVPQQFVMCDAMPWSLLHFLQGFVPSQTGEKSIFFRGVNLEEKTAYTETVYHQQGTETRFTLDAVCFSCNLNRADRQISFCFCVGPEIIWGET